MATEQQQIRKLFEEGSQKTIPIEIKGEGLEISPEEAQELEERLNRPYDFKSKESLNGFDFQTENARTEPTLARQTLSTWNAIAAHNYGEEDPFEVYQNSVDKKYENIKQELRDREVRRTTEDLDSLFYDLVQDGSETNTELAKQLPKAYSSIEEEMAGELGPYTAAIRSMYSGTNPVNPELEKEIALQAWFANHIQELTEKAGATDLAGMIFLADESLDISRIVGEFFGSEKGWNRYIQAFNSLPAEERFEQFKLMEKALVNATDGNELKIAKSLLELIDPMSDVGLSQGLDKITLGLAAFDVVALATVMAKIVGKGTKAIKVAKSLKEIKKAAEIATIAAKSPSAAKAVGMATDEISATIDPFEMEKIFEGAADGLSKEISDNFNLIDTYLDEIEVLSVGIEPTEVEKLAAIEKVKTELFEAPGVDNVTVDLVEGNQFTMSYDIKKGDEVERIVLTNSFIVDDITGGFSQTSLGATHLVKGIASPGFLFKKDSKYLRDNFTEILFASDVYRSRFEDILKHTFKPVRFNKRSQEKLNQILAIGDEMEETFSYNDLVVEGINGIRLSEKEFKVYADIRKLMKKAYVLKNKEVRDQLIAQNVKEVFVGTSPKIAKVFDSSENAATSVRLSETKSVHVDDPLEGDLNFISLDKETLDKYYDKGYVLSKSEEFFSIDGENYFQYALVNKEAVKNLPEFITHQRKGYIPLERENNFFVKVKKYGTVDGTRKVIGLETVRVANLRQEADAIKTQLIDEGIVADDIKILYDREMIAEDLEKELVGIHGGMYTSPRKRDQLLEGVEGKIPERIAPLEAISNYYTHIANRQPMSVYRLGITRRWMNHAKEVGALHPTYSGSFDEAVNILKKDLDPGVRSFLEKSHEQISFQIRIPTLGEKQLEGDVRRFAQWLEGTNLFGGKVGQTVVKSLYKLDHKDPISAARSAAFHPLLGMFNPAQFPVQAFGATIALSVNPILGARGLPKAMALGWLDNFKDPTSLKSAMQKISGEFKSIPGEELNAFYSAWKKTGLYDSIVVANPDLAAASRGMHIGPISTKAAFDKALMFYKAGELVNKRTSFATAWEWFKKKKGYIPKTDEDIKEVLSRAQIYMLNMTHSNKASWQKGLPSVPTQFQQVSAKFLEAVFGSELTAAEKARMLTMQLGFFGAAGVPLFREAADGIAGVMGVQPGDIDPDSLLAYRKGIPTYMLHQYLGANVEMSSRGAIAQGITDAIMDMASGNASVDAKVLFGPFGGVVDRSFQAAEDIINLGKIEMSSGEDLGGAEVRVAVDSVLDVASSWRNASKAYTLMNNPILRDSKGRPIKDLSGESMQTFLMMGLGFQHKDVEEIYLSDLADRRVDERIQDKTNTLIGMYHDLLVKTPDENRKKVMNVVWKSLMAEEDHATQRRIYQAAHARLTNPKTREETIIRKRLDDIGTGMLDSTDYSNLLISEEVD